MVCRFNGKRFKVGVGLTVKTENWSKKKQRLKERVTKGIEMMEQSVISREDLILIHKDSLVNLTKRLKDKLENIEMVDKRMCLVLGPKKGIYFEANNEIIESNSIPKGGWLLGENNERVTESENHYKSFQASNFDIIDSDLLSFDIDEEKLTQIAKEDPYRTFLFEKMWTPKRKNGINWMRKMLDNSESDN